VHFYLLFQFCWSVIFDHRFLFLIILMEVVFVEMYEKKMAMMWDVIRCVF